MPGKNNQVVFRADEEGVYEGQAATLSGQAYAAMRTEVEVVSPEEYEAFIESQKTDIQAAQDRVVGLIESGETPMSGERRPELVVDGFPRRRPRWIEIATSADHKDIGRLLISGALGFLFIALIELLLMRLQLAIPENSFLSPVTFNRMLSLYGATAIFLFAIPLALGLFYYVAPLQIGARGTALPRLGQIGAWLFIAGATVLYAGFLFTPSEAGVNPLPPLSELAFLRQQRRRRLGHGDGPGDARLRPDRDRPDGDAAQHARPGHGLAAAAGLLLGGGDLLLAAARDRPGDAGRDHDAD